MFPTFSSFSSSTGGLWAAPAAIMSNYSLPRAPRFYNQSARFQRAYRAQFTGQAFEELPNVNISQSFASLSAKHTDALSVYTEITPLAPAPLEIASPRPVYAYNPLPDIEGAIERFETSSNTPTDSTAVGTPATAPWKLPYPDTLDGINGHVGIIEHGPKLYERNLYTPVGYSSDTTDADMKTDDVYYGTGHANYYMAVEDIEAQLAPANPESIEEKLWKMYHLYKLF
ncbi:hypothetical protein BC629DRAFT_1594713 [Irpex lacteus]|nr:hypothetical protein BC629DRAFT_1594713 [Irpex lacteus]